MSTVLLPHNTPYLNRIQKILSERKNVDFGYE